LKVEHQYGIKRDFPLIRTLIDHNQTIINEIINDLENDFGYTVEREKSIIRQNKCQVDRVKTTLKQIMRDWSYLGKCERDAAYKPVIEEIERIFSDKNERPKKNVLVPGCGLGRLVWELFNAGFAAEGNEFSYFMLFASSFVLNKCFDIGPGEFQYKIFPFIHETSNIISWTDIMTEVRFPDIRLNETIEPSGTMNMGAGDFLDIYTETKWHSVITVFFIDTAHNIIDYIERIYKILHPGGTWINNGPLLYHFADQSDESIELSWEEVRQVIKKVGFKIKNERNIENASYTQNQKSLLQYKYQTIFFTATKPE